MDRLSMIVELLDDPAVARAVRRQLNLSDGEDLILQFAADDPALPPALRAIAQALESQARDELVIATLRNLLVGEPNKSVG